MLQKELFIAAAKSAHVCASLHFSTLFALLKVAVEISLLTMTVIPILMVFAKSSSKQHVSLGKTSKRLI